MKKLIGMVVLCLVMAPLVYSQSLTPAANQPDGAGRLVEEFKFYVRDFEMDHQRDHNKLNISISYRYVANLTKAEYPDFRLLAKDVETLLTNYPNEDDYWEIVNKRITAVLMNKYPALASVTSEVSVSPTKLIPFLRMSCVTRERAGLRPRRRL